MTKKGFKKVKIELKATNGKIILVEAELKEERSSFGKKEWKVCPIGHLEDMWVRKIYSL